MKKKPKKSFLIRAQKLKQFTWSERLLLIKVFLVLIQYHIIIKVIPFKKIQNYLGEVVEETPFSELTAEDIRLLQTLKLFINVAGRMLPWNIKCLARSCAVKTILNKKGLKNTLIIGVKHDQDEPFKAHAWLVCGDIIVTGGPTHKLYKVICKIV